MSLENPVLRAEVLVDCLVSKYGGVKTVEEEGQGTPSTLVFRQENIDLMVRITPDTNSFRLSVVCNPGPLNILEAERENVKWTWRPYLDATGCNATVFVDVTTYEDFSNVRFALDYLCMLMFGRRDVYVLMHDMNKEWSRQLVHAFGGKTTSGNDGVVFTNSHKTVAAHFEASSPSTFIRVWAQDSSLLSHIVESGIMPPPSVEKEIGTGSLVCATILENEDERLQAKKALDEIVRTESARAETYPRNPYPDWFPFVSQDTVPCTPERVGGVKHPVFEAAAFASPEANIDRPAKIPRGSVREPSVMRPVDFIQRGTIRPLLRRDIGTVGHVELGDSPVGSPSDDLSEPSSPART